MQKLLFVLLAATWACTEPVPAQSVLDAAKTEALLKADSSVQLVDLRTPGEIRQTGTVAGALEINFNSADFPVQISKLDKSKPVVVYCAAGGRSARAAAQLTKMGFKNVYDFTGGMNDWKAQGKKTVPGSTRQ